MARAGLAAANAARKLLSGNHLRERVLVLAGPGNNGGDGIEAALHLRAWGFAVTVCCVAPAKRPPADAARAHAAWAAQGGVCARDLPALAEFDLIIDAMFGIGLTRDLAAPYAGWIACVNDAAVPVLALDVPSGLDADSGHIHAAAIRATRTLTFIADKPGLHTHHGTDCAGEIEIAGLDLRTQIVPGPDSGALLAPADFSACLSPRLRNTHKGTYGTLAIIGGAPGMSGAVLIAARAALKLGAGKVIGAMLDGSLSFDPLYPEVMLCNATGALGADLDTVVVGPGLGQSDAARALLEAYAAIACPLVLDADALNLIALDARLAARITRREHPTVLTPHPLEAARLLGRSLAAVQRDRVAAALALARTYNAQVVLKGAGSVIATPQDRWLINPSGNPGMAAAGMGDALAGIAGAFIAQGFAVADAVAAAVHLHGAAADALVARGVGPVGLIAGETVDAARTIWNGWINAYARSQGPPYAARR